MNKRKIKKKFNLTCKEFKVMTLSNPNMFKDCGKYLYGSYASSCLEKTIFFWGNKRISRDDYYRLLETLSDKK